MTREDRQEALSLVYVKAVAAACGMTYSTRSKDYCIDVSLHEVERRVGRLYETGLQLDLQVKSTAAAAAATRTTVGFDLPAKAYDDLRFESATRRLLAVFLLPPDEADWLRQTRGRLELRGACTGCRSGAGRR